MKCRKAYGIMPVGENDRSAHVAQQKAPEVATPGLFYSVLGGWIISQGQKCHKKPFPLVYHQSHKEKSVKGGHRPQRLPLILFFVV